MQTIHINNNQFFNTSSTALDDIYAVIAIIWPNPSNLTQPTEGLKLIDCLIQNNLCDKNQMIAIASSANGSGNIQSSIVTVSTRVTGNSCGSIGVLGAADNERNYNTATAGIAYDKSYGFIIADNVCRFIGQTNSAGVSCLNQTKYTSPAITFNTCSMMIQRNICNWIQLMPWIIATPTNVACYQENAAVWILDNSLRAYNTTFLGLFSNNPVVFDNNGIMILPPLTNPIPAIIKGNTVIQGSALNNSNAVVTYDYNESAYIGIEAIIDSNIFSNLASTGHMLDITSPAGSILTITNNQFYRNGSTISSYINIAHAIGGVISNNSFDSTTIDGTSIALISGFTNFQGAITQNKNQTGFASIDPNQFNWHTGGIDAVFLNNSNDGLPATSGWSVVINGLVSNVAINAALDSVIPPGAKLVYVVIGATYFAGSGSATMAFQILQGRSNSFTQGSFSGSIADVAGNGGNFAAQVISAASSGFPTPITIVGGSSRYASLPLSANNIYGGAGSIQLFLYLNIATAAQIVLSPILIQYQW